MLLSAKKLDDINSIIARHERVVLCFLGPWCPQCAYMEKVINILADKYKDIVFVKVLVGRDDGIVKEYQVYEIPLTVTIVRRKVKRYIAGAYGLEKFEKWLLDSLG